MEKEKVRESIVDKTYWNDHWKNIQFEIVPDNHPVRQWLEREIPNKKDASCFEAGCYPGKFLAVFGEKGYELNGVDSFEDTGAMLHWLKNQGYKIGTFYQSDFSHFKISDIYDVVCSFGFIEHFSNWQEVVRKHIELTKRGGSIIIDVPNLKSPLYRFLYKIFEPQVLKNHVVLAMDMKTICDTLEKDGCEIKSATYIGTFYFRFVTRHDVYSVIVAKIINLLKPVFYLLPKSVYRRYIGIIGIKK
ncbi:class I SAM-dependent methyltransferase [Patescibacteria group bacterium]